MKTHLAAESLSVTAVATAPAPVDMATLRAVTWGDEAFLRDLVETFLADSGALMPELHRAAAADDGRLMETTAHRLKGSSATLGANQLAALLQQLETLAGTASLPQAIALLPEVSQEFHAVRQCLQAELAPAST